MVLKVWLKMKDEIIIKISMERLGNTNVGKVNNMIKSFVEDLKKEEDLEVLDYSQLGVAFVSSSSSSSSPNK
jgi:hypothetical protein